ncbi:CHRD domain-containing protein [Swingsia samuiensis]|uniref:CHRD domain-containing protein n=1 Tax=Swingsia samuiensis TaxID=1293412 RepID=A0A4Y6UMP3_9PROT|nr:CHRD domain-containing protein [Swingsia samuiensis]QDH17627.1 CHRD domain-containing protein [Swingsia samuiensis]
MLSRLFSTILIASFAAVPFYASAETVQLFGPFKTEHNATTPVSGSVFATLDTDQNTLMYNIKAEGLSGPITTAHLHGPAEANIDGKVISPLPGPFRRHMDGTVHLTPDQQKIVISGKSYINLHTSRYTTGEARAQLTPISTK